MPAHSEVFPWPSYYGHYRFFEQRMREHAGVQAVGATRQSGLYSLTRSDGTRLAVFVCDCYSFGLAEYDEAVAALGRLDVVIINSSWCNYTTAVKRHCRSQKVGVFTIGEFMAALNKPKYWEYLTKEQMKVFKRNDWL